jgi:hypothetical protein
MTGFGRFLTHLVQRNLRAQACTLGPLWRGQPPVEDEECKHYLTYQTRLEAVIFYLHIHAVTLANYLIVLQMMKHRCITAYYALLASSGQSGRSCRVPE